MSETGAARAWQFLKTQSGLSCEVAQHGGRGAGHQGGALSAAITNAGRPQGRCVGSARLGGPLAANGPVSPFWAEAPMLVNRRGILTPYRG